MKDQALNPLLKYAIAHNLLLIPWTDQDDGIVKIMQIRNTWSHANYEQATKQANCNSIMEYIHRQFGGELETMYAITEWLFAQIDAHTGTKRPWVEKIKGINKVNNENCMYYGNNWTNWFIFSGHPFRKGI